MTININGTTGISGVDGSAATPALQGSDTNTGISFGTDEVAINTGGTQRALIDSSGRLGLGSSSPQTPFVCSNAGANGFEIDPGQSSGTVTGVNSYNRSTSAFTPLRLNASELRFDTSSTERMRLTATGLGVGTASPQGALSIVSGTATQLTIQTVAGAIDTLKFDSWHPSSAKPYYSWCQQGAEAMRLDNAGRLLVGTSSAGGTELIQVQGTSGGSALPGGIALRRSSLGGGDDIGYVNFTNASGNIHAGIKAFVDGTPGAGDYPGALVFSTTADGASSPTERVRINNAGMTSFGNTSAAKQDGNPVVVKITTSHPQTGIEFDTGAGGARYACQFWQGSTFCGRIATSSAGTTTYATSSDYRLKENVTLLTGATDRLKQLPVHRFNFIADPTKTVDGFIAHEVQSVVPECVVGEKDAVAENGNPIYQGIDQSKLVPLLTAALQEAITRIETLEAEVQALKGGN